MALYFECCLFVCSLFVVYCSLFVVCCLYAIVGRSVSRSGDLRIGGWGSWRILGGTWGYLGLTREVLRGILVGT